MPDFLYAIDLLRDSVWGGNAVMVAILIPVLAQLLRSASFLPSSTQPPGRRMFSEVPPTSAIMI